MLSAPAARVAWPLALFALALVSAFWLGLAPADLIPGPHGWELLRRFGAAALSPALRTSDLAQPTLPLAFEAALHTVAFAAAASSLALVAGAVLGVLASRRWWNALGLSLSAQRGLYATMRLGIGLLRSVHELLWALALLAAFGLVSAAAVLAIAIPYTGTLAKVFSELLDEAPAGSQRALEAAGAPPLASFVFGLLPHTLPDLSAYAFYRFECALRSAAVLGFFGFPTLGKLVYESAGQLYFRETWTYLYVLIALVAAAELWSGALRRRLTVA